jgi:hypothetical protein
VRAVSPPVTRPEDTVNEGNLPAVVHAAMQRQLKAQPERRDEILARVTAIRTREDAHEYLVEVRQIVVPAANSAQGG